MLGHWPNIKPSLFQFVVFVGRRRLNAFPDHIARGTSLDTTSLPRIYPLCIYANLTVGPLSYTVSEISVAICIS